MTSVLESKISSKFLEQSKFNDQKLSYSTIMTTSIN